jgi:hypothetical protein
MRAASADSFKPRQTRAVTAFGSEIRRTRFPRFALADFQFVVSKPDKAKMFVTVVCNLIHFIGDNFVIKREGCPSLVVHDSQIVAIDLYDHIGLFDHVWRREVAIASQRDHSPGALE